jgi:AcrR family transcriptional regulator
VARTKRDASAKTPKRARKQQSASREDPSGNGDGTHTSRRILDATAEVLGRIGVNKLSLSDVAQQAGVSRPTLYRWFRSKEELIDAFTRYEEEMFESGMSSAIAGLRGTQKLDAALRFMVEFQRQPSGGRMVDAEPEQAIAQLARVLPIMRERLAHLIPGPDSAVAAAIATRVAVSHWVVRADDDDQLLTQLRHATGIRSRQSRSSASPVSSSRRDGSVPRRRTKLRP